MKTSLVKKHSGHIISARLPQFIQGRLPANALHNELLILFKKKYHFHKKRLQNDASLFKIE